MRINNIAGTSLPEQLTYPLAVAGAKWFDADPGQDARKIGLFAAIAPDLANNRRTRPERRPLLLKHAQLCTHHPITPVDRD